MLDNPWKIALLVVALVVARIAWTLWKKAPSRKSVIEFLDAGLIAITLVFCIVRPFVMQAFYIPSGSMVPTLYERDRILVNRFIYRLNPPRRGDIIVFDAPAYALNVPGQKQADFVKRLIGLPGDKIEVRGSEGVFVNGEKLQEAPETITPDYYWPADGKPYVVPKGNYLVLGDNRINSHDSHRWVDPVTHQPRPELSADRLLGKAIVTFWPLTRIRLLNDHHQAHIPSDLKTSRAAALTRPMPRPSPRGLWKFELALHAEGHRYVAGVDEAGRGPLAGPVVAAAVILPPRVRLLGLADSKTLTPARASGCTT